MYSFSEEREQKQKEQSKPEELKKSLIRSYIEERDVIVDQITHSDCLSNEVMEILVNRLNKLDGLLPNLIEKYEN